MNQDQKAVLIRALNLLAEQLASPTSADRDNDPAKANRDIEIARGLIAALESPRCESGEPLMTILSKAEELEAVIDELEEMGFDDDEPINGGDCVDVIATRYEHLMRLFPRN